MKAEYRFETIAASFPEEIIQHYPRTIKEKLREPDELRYVQLPKQVQDRKKADGAYLTKDEVVQLVDWKLHHGTYRPKLKQLVESNAAEEIQSTTHSAFASFDGSSEKAKSCLTELATFKGIGPATASLLLSVAFPDDAPFFSDELFRWCFWEEGKGKGWDRPIKYTPKEYMQLFAKIKELRARIDVKAVDVEKLAYVLGNADAETISALDTTKGGLPDQVKRKAKDIEDDELAQNVARPALTKKTRAVPHESIASNVLTTAPQKTAKHTAISKKSQAAGTRSSTRLRSTDK